MNKEIQRLVVVGLALFALSAFAGVKDEQIACDQGNANLCNKLGVRYQSGNGVREDQYEATKTFKKACSLGDKNGCFNLAWQYETGQGVKEKNIQEAFNLFEKTCNIGGDAESGASCAWLATWYRDGKWVQQDILQAVQLFEKACRLGMTDACAPAKELRSEMNAKRAPDPKSEKPSTTSGGEPVRNFVCEA